LVEQFVLIKLSALFNDVTVEPSLYHFTQEECSSKMYLAGQVSGIFYFDINAHPPVFKYLKFFFALKGLQWYKLSYVRGGHCHSIINWCMKHLR
jgi:hypothetical protein